MLSYKPAKHIPISMVTPSNIHLHLIHRNLLFKQSFSIHRNFLLPVEYRNSLLRGIFNSSDKMMRWNGNSRSRLMANWQENSRVEADKHKQQAEGKQNVEIHLECGCEMQAGRQKHAQMHAIAAAWLTRVKSFVRPLAVRIFPSEFLLSNPKHSISAARHAASRVKFARKNSQSGKIRNLEEAR